jgi:hypothetical protein
MKKEETSKKIPVTEADFGFLKKINGLKMKPEEFLIKRAKMTEKGKSGSVEYDVNTVIVVDEASSYMVQATQLKPMFTEEKFGMKNIKGFLKAVETYGEMEEQKGGIIFGSDKKKITYKKLDHTTIGIITWPVVDTAGYTSIALTFEEIKEIQSGLKNDLSDFASLRISPDNKLILKIGELSYDNIYEQEIKDVIRKEKNEIKFLTKLAYLTRLFMMIDEGSKTTLFMKLGQPLIFSEKNSTTHTKTMIAPAIDDMDTDDENIEKVIENEEV